MIPRNSFFAEYGYMPSDASEPCGPEDCEYLDGGPEFLSLSAAVAFATRRMAMPNSPDWIEVGEWMVDPMDGDQVFRFHEIIGRRKGGRHE
jgi:hypothetical protein